MADAAALARSYYRALDGHDYDALADLIAPGFVHDRPDLTLEGRERFVRFMREERPQKETTHAIDGLFLPVESDTERTDAGGSPAPRSDSAGDVVVRGRLLDADGDRIVGFVDAFAVADGSIARIDTYTA